MSDAVAREAPLAGANLCPHSQNTRLRLAVAGAAVGLGLAVAFSRAEVAHHWRLVTFIPFMISSIAAFQGLYRVCPSHAMIGQRESVTGQLLPQDDPHQVAASRKVAGRVLMMSFAVALGATATMMVIP